MVKLFNKELFKVEEDKNTSTSSSSCKGITRFKVAFDESRLVSTVFHEKEKVNESPTKIKVIEDPKNPKKMLARISQKDGLSYDSDVYIIALPFKHNEDILPVSKPKGISFYKSMIYNAENPFTTDGVVYTKIFYFIMVPDVRCFGAPLSLDALTFRVDIRSLDTANNRVIIRVNEFCVTPDPDKPGSTRIHLNKMVNEREGLPSTNPEQCSKILPLVRPRKNKKDEKKKSKASKVYEKSSIPQAVPDSPDRNYFKKQIKRMAKMSFNKGGTDNSAATAEKDLHEKAKNFKGKFEHPTDKFSGRSKKDFNNKDNKKPTGSGSKPITSQEQLDRMISKAISDGDSNTNFVMNRNRKKRKKH